MRHHPIFLLSCVTVVFLLAASAFACQVPVFRYALERWTPDRYRVLLLHEKELDKQEAELLASWNAGRSNKRNLLLESVKISNSKDPTIHQLWKLYGKEGRATLVSLYPSKTDSFRDTVAHVSEWSQDNLESLQNSPVRTEIAHRLRQGHSAVWILLESGDTSKDEAALKTLEEQLAQDASTIELPTSEALDVKPEVLEQVKIKLRIEFSIVRLKRDNPSERFLIDSLLNSESDLREFDKEPIAFPVFGRGLVLYAIVGDGIAPETIRQASSFIVGPCSCQVKEQNPGFDLLLEVDWDQAVGTTLISQPIPGQTGTKPKLLSIPPGRVSK